MKKINQTLIKSYKSLDGQVKTQEENMANLSEKLRQAQGELDQATANSEKAEREAKNNKLITLKDIESARKKIQYSKYTIMDHCQIIKNLELAIGNSQNAIQDLVKNQNTTMKEIWEGYASILSTKIHSLIKEDIARLWVCMLTSHPGSNPLDEHSAADALSFMFRPSPDRINSLRREILNEILNGNK